ncbi:uncharacterized protein ACLA_055340 [Aspergillus clavatus NRRL 1]|uniref:Uncharacterized protein n=1 Tax=Aspergillus clavatus (strain ATCC 1007 / CBS 513.65 / DSM 816 / NCTC 3887 / NRRL 1 / QM 1276 / 107) TaxID=344612 RepID=A1C9G2_ASPCL|nr:uncharacterized protein ACLA_055340 [Aspergillus clavatus NRRL 1]EAW13486.1 hypothetical protein ACLA_055340 [Aspergillus clavatus NRRL 1]
MIALKCNCKSLVAQCANSWPCVLENPEIKLVKVLESGIKLTAPSIPSTDRISHRSEYAKYSLPVTVLNSPNFSHASSHGHTECEKLALLENELCGVSDDLIRELLIRSGRQHLLAIPKDVNCDLPCVFKKVTFAEVEMIEHRLKCYVDEMIERRLESHILNEIVDSAVSECRDQIYDKCKTNEAEFHEQVDDGNSEVRNTANEYMDEIEEQAQRYMHEIEEQAQQYMKDIEDQGIKFEMSAKKKVTKLKQWFNFSTQSLLDSKSSPSHELGTNARRGSI